MSTLHPDIIAELRDVFNLFDTRGDGQLSCKELSNVLRNLGITPTEMELQELLQVVDQDQSGTIEFSEFVYLMSTKLSEPSDPHKEAYQMLDKDYSEDICAAELRHVMASLGERITVEEAEEMMALADADGDGVISYSDFMAIMEDAL